MNDEDTDYQLLGRAIVEELLLSAGLAQAKQPSADSIQVGLTFAITADADRGCLKIRWERIGSPPIDIQLGMSL
jgi:hypothetical protein